MTHTISTSVFFFFPVEIDRESLPAASAGYSFAGYV